MLPQRIGASEHDTAILQAQLAQYNDILATDSRNIETLSKRAMIYKKLDQPDKFLADLQTAKKYRHIERTFLKIDDEIVNRIEEIEKSPTTVDKSVLALVAKKASTALRKHKNADAIIYYTQAIQIDRRGDEWYAGRAAGYFKNNQADKALFDYSTAIFTSTSSIELAKNYFNRSLIHLSFNNLEAAISDVENSIEHVQKLNLVDRILLENNIPTSFSIACTDKAKRERENDCIIAAEKHIQAALDKKPSVETHIEHGILLRLTKKYLESMNAFDRALELSTGDKKLTYRITAEKKLVLSNLENDDTLIKQMSAKEAKITESGAKDKKEYNIDKSIKKKKIKKPIPIFFHAKAYQKTNHSTVITYKENTAETKVETETLFKQDAEEKITERAKIENQRKERHKLREKRKKEERLKLRQEKKLSLKTNHSEITLVTANNSTETRYASIFSNSLFSTFALESTPKINISLLDIEKALFKTLFSLNDKKNQYKTYLVGGSVFDRVRSNLCNYAEQPIKDIDIITEVPCSDILSLFQAQIFSDKNVDGIFHIHFHNMTITIVHRETLKSLAYEADDRDFHPLYADSQGNIYDPTGWAIADLKTGHLRTVNLPKISLQEDPIRILRAIYQSTKRNLIICSALREQMRKQKDLLVTQVSPGRVNAWIRKICSYGLASKNYLASKKYGIIRTLFPELDLFFNLDHSWLMKQMSETDKVEHASIQYVYASFIISAVMQKYGPIRDTSAILQCSITVIQSSPLFIEAYCFNQISRSEQMLHIYLKPAINSWLKFHCMTQKSDLKFFPTPPLVLKPAHGYIDDNFIEPAQHALRQNLY